MSVTFVDPRAEPATPVEPYELAVRLSGETVTVGLLANGFPDSVTFLDQVEAELAALLPDASFCRYDKGDASSVVSEEMLRSIVAECGAVVAAYGH
jgi:hypothetical protein